MLVHEECVLEPHEASLQNPDDWPTFNLERITVVSQKTGEKTSLLSAHTANPVRVTGILEEIDDDLQHLSQRAQVSCNGNALTVYSTRQGIPRPTHQN